MPTLVAAISVSMDRMPSRREMGRQCLKEKVGPRRTPLLWVEVADSCVHSLKEGFRINMEVDETVCLLVGVGQERVGRV